MKKTKSKKGAILEVFHLEILGANRMQIWEQIVCKHILYKFVIKHQHNFYQKISDKIRSKPYANLGANSMQTYFMMKD